MKYYYAEHMAAYRRLQREGKSQWNDLFTEDRAVDFGTFPNRAFLEHALEQLDLPAPEKVDVWEYGCGTGPAACFLAARGFRVNAIDLIPEAIGLARQFAQERGLDASFNVQDVCALADEPVSHQYDLIVDSFCLQSIVTDADRARVFAAVRARLKPDGYYLISTAMYEPERSYDPGFRYDSTTGICYEKVPLDRSSDDAVEIEGEWYLPHRRHHRAEALHEELARAGFRVLPLTGTVEGVGPGDLVCVRSNHDA